MAIIKQWPPDLQNTVVDGVDRGKEPELIGPHQLHYGRNVTVRGGRVRSRPRIVRRTTLPAGKLQGLGAFNGISKLFASVAGRVYQIDPQGWSYVEKTNDQDRGSAYRARHYYCETVGSLVIQDGQGRAFIYDGAKWRRAKDDEVPVGTAMAFGSGRLAVVVNGNAVRIGDIRKPDQHQSELTFTETYALLGGGDLEFPDTVRALAVIPVIDTGSGHGPLIVGCSHQTFTLKTQITARDMWTEIGFQTVLLPSRGIVGPNAWTVINQDLYFRSSDGLRSIRTSTSDYESPGLTPLSSEVRYRFDHDTQALLQDCSVVYFDNRLICTHSPFVYDNRSLATGLISLNFEALSASGQKSRPVYDGEWDCGVVFAQFVVAQVDGVERCFALGRDGAGTNGIWEVLRESDEPAGEEPTQAIETRAMTGDGPHTLKTLRRADLAFSDLRGDLAVRVYFRPEKFPFWLLWDEFTAEAPTVASSLMRVWPQYRSGFQTRTPTAEMNPLTQHPFAVARSFQVRVEWEGFARLDHVAVFTEPLVEAPYADNEEGLVVGPLVDLPPGGHFPAYWQRYDMAPAGGI